RYIVAIKIAVDGAISVGVVATVGFRVAQPEGVLLRHTEISAQFQAVYFGEFALDTVETIATALQALAEIGIRIVVAELSADALGVVFNTEFGVLCQDGL